MRNPNLWNPNLWNPNLVEPEPVEPEPVEPEPVEPEPVEPEPVEPEPVEPEPVEDMEDMEGCSEELVTVGELPEDLLRTTCTGKVIEPFQEVELIEIEIDPNIVKMNTNSERT